MGLVSQPVHAIARAAGFLSCGFVFHWIKVLQKPSGHAAALNMVDLGASDSIASGIAALRGFVQSF